MSAKDLVKSLKGIAKKREEILVELGNEEAKIISEITDLHNQNIYTYFETPELDNLKFIELIHQQHPQTKSFNLSCHFNPFIINISTPFQIRTNEKSIFIESNKNWWNSVWVGPLILLQKSELLTSQPGTNLKEFFARTGETVTYIEREAIYNKNVTDMLLSAISPCSEIISNYFSKNSLVNKAIKTVATKQILIKDSFIEDVISNFKEQVAICASDINHHDYVSFDGSNTEEELSEMKDRINQIKKIKFAKTLDSQLSQNISNHKINKI